MQIDLNNDLRESFGAWSMGNDAAEVAQRAVWAVREGTVRAIDGSVARAAREALGRDGVNIRAFA
ncbi:hypothetical protein [Cupriavidus neocaledonicus]|uniref:Uncharacterized protein n=1 Tax=Cupriavidus neocaledonicus TaxID=1040979 RepID=A0A375HNF4_9BURK|nr:hypothetical protein [Cupriavidus neocaledonicus]SOZ38583.1 conserved hypothetical protein [Cupriavidus neocaledonicus]SPD59771.1 conserved protein of unknown function [Cupriavidus neocaledonicus]